MISSTFDNISFNNNGIPSLVVTSLTDMRVPSRHFRGQKHASFAKCPPQRISHSTQAQLNGIFHCITFLSFTIATKSYIIIIRLVSPKKVAFGFAISTRGVWTCVVFGEKKKLEYLLSSCCIYIYIYIYIYTSSSCGVGHIFHRSMFYSCVYAAPARRRILDDSLVLLPFVVSKNNFCNLMESRCCCLWEGCE